MRVQKRVMGLGSGLGNVLSDRNVNEQRQTVCSAPEELGKRKRESHVPYIVTFHRNTKAFYPQKTARTSRSAQGSAYEVYSTRQRKVLTRVMS